VSGGGGGDVNREEEDPELDELATMLVQLDKRAYQRALRHDANNLFEKIILPMSLPWSHQDSAFARMMRMPFDIDDLVAVDFVGGSDAPSDGLEQDGNTETMCAGGSNSGGGSQHSSRSSGASVPDNGGGEGKEQGANPHPKRRKWQ
jgi:hypothetical protein